VGQYPRELANRVFDIMTIQKATAVLLLDGVSIVLTTVLGLVLLAFYHPFLLGFDIVLLISMISITWLLGRGGIRTAIEESITKYRVAHWLQDVIASPSAFKTGGGETLAVQRANQLTTEYVQARQRQFRVVIRQVAFAIGLQAVASTAVLALGGWLVIDGQLTLGQLVASELVVTVVVGAFAKAGKSLEKFYDLMAGIDKVGHLIDVPIDPRQELSAVLDGPATVSWGDLMFSGATFESKVPAATIEAGSRVAIVGNDVDGRSLLARTLAGLVTPSSGQSQVAGFDSAQASISSVVPMIGYAGGNDLFHGTLRENVELGRSGIGQHVVREALRKVGLAEVIVKLPEGTQTRLQTQGYPLTEIQSRQVVLARAIVAEPRLLIVDGLLDDLAPDDRQAVWESLTATGAPWTLVINTNREDIAKLCDIQLAVRK
jgi:putative ABC transport system ATP-binding protein